MGVGRGRLDGGRKVAALVAVGGLITSAVFDAKRNRIAFWVAEPAEVDRVAAVVEAAGGLNVSGPKSMPYGPDYYAVYFSDPCGNGFEVYFRQAG